jgi:peptidoglycan/LPS O-acetylase OafA/YrhL
MPPTATRLSVAPEPAAHPRVARGRRALRAGPTGTPSGRGGGRGARRTDIEGLRAVAVCAVLAFHASVPLFDGGFVGVDVFFVISGFLISGLMLDELTRTGRLDLKDFYARRARRILPAAGLVLVSTAVAAWVLLPPLRTVAVARDLLTAATYVVNWHFIAAQTDYMRAGLEASPVLHYWSLAVEEQFYLAWPVLLIAAATAGRQLGRARVWFGAAVAVPTAVSFGLSLYWTATSGPLAYMSSPSRAWQFGIGAALALAVRGRRELAPTPVATLAGGWLGLAAIATACFAFDEQTAFPGFAALLPTLGAGAVIASGSGAFAAGVRYSVPRLLAARPARFLGRISYSWYLWHWPVLVIADALHPGLPWVARLALVAAAGGLAWLTTRWVEDPIRRDVLVASRPSRGLSVGMVSSILPLAASLVVGSLALSSMENLDLPAVDDVSSGISLLSASPTRTPLTGGPVRPAPAKASKDWPFDAGRCLAPPEVTSPPVCIYGDSSGSRTIVLIGDSHAFQWVSAFDSLGKRRHWRVLVLAKQGCPIARLPVVNPKTKRPYIECDEWRTEALRELRSTSVDAIFATQENRYMRQASDLKVAWNEALGQLVRNGAPVVYMRDTPYPGIDVPECISGSMDAWVRCARPIKSAVWPDPVAVRLRLRPMDDVEVWDPTPALCPEDSCPVVWDGILMYMDHSHMSTTFARALAPSLEQAIAALPGVSTALSN